MEPTATLETVMGLFSACPPLTLNPNPFLSLFSLMKAVFLTVPLSMSEPGRASNSISRLMTFPELLRSALASLWFRWSVAVPLMPRMWSPIWRAPLLTTQSVNVLFVNHKRILPLIHYLSIHSNKKVLPLIQRFILSVNPQQ